jgi:hypothetical protein
MTGRSIHRVRRPGGAKPLRDAILHDADRDLLYTHAIADARRHARKLCGLVPYSRNEVRGVESAAIIYRMLGIIAELQACKSVRVRRELEREIRDLRIERQTIKGEMQRWGLSMPHTAQQEFPFIREG